MSKHQHPGNPRQMRDARGHFIKAPHPTALSEMEAETSGSSGNGFTLAEDYELTSSASKQQDATIDAGADGIIRHATVAAKVFVCIAVAAAVAGVIVLHGWAS